jgi:predicted adenylyl cyclase CyaB
MIPAPARNIEIKARLSDLPRLRARVASLAPAPPEVLEQTDTFFVVPRGRLKLRQFADGAGELIFYERPDHAGPKESSYVRYACHEPAALAAILGRALGVRGIVEKRREVFMIGRTRTHLDEVRGLGSFLELEVVLDDGEAGAEGEHVARELLAAFEIPESALVAHAYIDLLEEPPGRGSSA